MGDHPDDLTTAAYIDGTLPASERGAIEEHLAVCHACRAGIHLVLAARDAGGIAVPGDALARARSIGRQGPAARIPPVEDAMRAEARPPAPTVRQTGMPADAQARPEAPRPMAVGEEPAPPAPPAARAGRPLESIRAPGEIPALERGGAAEAAGPAGEGPEPPVLVEPDYTSGFEQPAAPRRGGLRRLAVAAAVLVGAAALFVIARQAGLLTPGPGSVYRGELTGAFDVLSPAPGAVLSPSELTFRWSEVPGADRYVITIHQQDATPVDSVEVRAPATELGWPAEALPPPPVSLVWRVRALSADRVIAESRPIPMELR